MTSPSSPRAPAQSGPTVLSVSVLTGLIKADLEGIYPDLWVEGELSGVKYHTSGHCYFTLKDSAAQISCNLWRTTLARVRFRLRDGEKVLVRGGLSVYEPRGTYSLVVNRIEPRGIGELQLAFEELKRRLHAEGLFAPERKRPLPYFVNRIGIVTSPTGAALRDLLQVMFRRNPHLEVVVAPARVQGEGAGLEIAQAVERLNRQGQVEVIIVGRGGGSYEDLFCFNDEGVARAIAASRIPIVSAVGHEVDVTIADFVADLRAPTPSAAAELVVKDQQELRFQIDQRQRRLERAMQVRLRQLQQRILGLSERLRDPRRILAEQRRRLEVLRGRLVRAMHRQLELRQNRAGRVVQALKARSPQQRLLQEKRALELHSSRLRQAMPRILALRRARLGAAVGRLDALSPLAVLSRGYAIVRREDDGQVVRRAQQVEPGEHLVLRLAEGELLVRVERL